jgi:uroporphyrinogen decarboxylase
MNGRERFDAMLSFSPVDRGFNFELPLWAQTYARWYREGMPKDVHVGDLMKGCEHFHIDRIGYLPLSIVAMMPPFEEEVLEEDERYVTKRHTDGSITRALKEGSVGGMRMSMDQHLSHAVSDRSSWQDVKQRYDPRSPARYPEWWADVKRCLKGRNYPLALTHNGCFGLYSFLRRLMGTELACTIFYDDPVLVEEILDYWTNYLIEIIHPALDDIKVDFFNYFEDFSYKAGPLIGPNIFRQFLLPHYRRINDLLRAHGVRHIWLDSDGNSEVLIPLLIEAGITCHWPLERASDMDPLKLRQKYGHDLALAGGIDKRALAQGPEAIEAELYHHVPQLLEDGGYLPALDHAFPPDISYDNFQYYLELKAKLLES